MKIPHCDRVDFPKTVAEHYDNVAALGCLISGSPFPTLHHVHSASMSHHGYHSGMAQRGVSDALVIPIAEHYHTGGNGIDSGYGVHTWEHHFGTQWDFIQQVSDCVGYDLIALHKRWLENPPVKGRRR